MNRRVYVLLPGIKTDPSDWRNWAPRMATEIMVRTTAKAEEFRYYALALSPKGKQTERVEYVCDLVTRYAASGHSVVIAAHSNGAIIATEAIRQCPAVIESLHLLAPACSSDFGKNGLNAALQSGKVGQVHVYTGTKDWVLQWAAKAGSWLGYGQLGWLGPQAVLPSIASRVHRHESANGHGDYFLDNHFDGTFKLITAGEA